MCNCCHFSHVSYSASGLRSPEGLAVDWISRTIFYTDSTLDRIEVADLEGTYRKIIVDTGLVNPRAIAVDATGGYVNTFYMTFGLYNDVMACIIMSRLV